MVQSYKRRQVKLTEIADDVNAELEGDTTPEVRQALSGLLERQLKAAGVYGGFEFLGSELDDKGGIKAGADITRRRYTVSL